MTQVVLETEQGDRVVIVAHPAGGRLFHEFARSAPREVELSHVKWSGDAVYFSHSIPTVPTSEELTRMLDPGTVAYVPDLSEFIIVYGVASPRDQRGTIDVARVGVVARREGLASLGTRILRHGVETARVIVEPRVPGRHRVNVL